MPLDDTQLKGLVDSNLPDATPTQQRRITAPVMRYVLKTLIDWVKGAAYSWLRVGDNVPTANQNDTIYHTGKVIVGVTADDQSGALLQAPSANIATIISARLTSENLAYPATVLRPIKRALFALTESLRRLRQTPDKIVLETALAEPNIAGSTPDDPLLNEQLNFIQQISSDISKLAERLSK